MAYDEKVADRVRALLRGRRGISEKKMFGGICFLHRGNMCCGVTNEDFMVRVGAEAYEEVLARKHAREMDFTGRPLKGMVYVSKPGIRTKRQLEAWVDRGLSFARTLPAK